MARRARLVAPDHPDRHRGGDCARDRRRARVERLRRRKRIAGRRRAHGRTGGCRSWVRRGRAGGRTGGRTDGRSDRYRGACSGYAGTDGDRSASSRADGDYGRDASAHDAAGGRDCAAAHTRSDREALRPAQPRQPLTDVYSRTISPLLPPRFSAKRTDSTRMPRSTALHMS